MIHIWHKEEYNFSDKIPDKIHDSAGNLQLNIQYLETKHLIGTGRSSQRDTQHVKASSFHCS